MKKIIVPQQNEQASYFSDFSGKPFGEDFDPPVELKLSFNYGSKFDGSDITFHLSDEDVAPILDLIKLKLNPDTKKILERELELEKDGLQSAIEARDPVECEMRISDISLIERLIK
jgi:hypothetical protein